MYLDLIDETERVEDDHVKLVEKIILFASQYLQLSDNIECSVTFVNNNRIQEINKEYRGKDYPTDVISFAMDDDLEGEVDFDFETLLPEMNVSHHLGDIIISIDKAQEQAKEYNHSFERELGFLALHGFLHLNGYDHMNEKDEKEMFSLQDDILRTFGLGR